MRRFADYTPEHWNEATPEDVAAGIVFRHGPVRVTKAGAREWTVEAPRFEMTFRTKALAIHEADFRLDVWNERTGAV